MSQSFEFGYRALTFKCVNSLATGGVVSCMQSRY